MSRLKVLRANPRRTLAALATLLVAVGITAASGASFTAQSVNPNNTFTAGTLKLGNSNNGAVLTASNLKPGGPAQTGEVTITNTGSLDGAVKLSKTGLVEDDNSNKIAGKLNLVVTDCGPDLDCVDTTDNGNVYTGTVGTMGANIAAGNFAGNGGAHKYEFAVDLDTSALDNLQGKGATAAFTWDAA